MGSALYGAPSPFWSPKWDRYAVFGTALGTLLGAHWEIESPLIIMGFLLDLNWVENLIF